MGNPLQGIRGSGPPLTWGDLYFAARVLLDLVDLFPPTADDCGRGKVKNGGAALDPPHTPKPLPAPPSTPKSPPEPPHSLSPTMPSGTRYSSVTVDLRKHMGRVRHPLAPQNPPDPPNLPPGPPSSPGRGVDGSQLGRERCGGNQTPMRVRSHRPPPA